MKQPKYSKGQRVRIVVNNVQPEYIGQIGRISQVRYLDVEQPVYKVRVKGVTLRLWATEDCLQEVANREKLPGKPGETAGETGRNCRGLWVSAAAESKSTAR